MFFFLGWLISAPLSAWAQICYVIESWMSEFFRGVWSREPLRKHSDGFVFFMTVFIGFLSLVAVFMINFTEIAVFAKIQYINAKDYMFGR